MFYKIEETVGKGLYITWEGTYLTRAAAVKALEQEVARSSSAINARVWPYSRGRGYGAVRLADDCE